MGIIRNIRGLMDLKSRLINLIVEKRQLLRQLTWLGINIIPKELNQKE